MSKCKICGAEFVRRGIGHKCCSIEHAIEWVKAEKLRKEERADRDKRQTMKSRAQWLKEAQNVFNRYIRERDKDKPCISCGRHHEGQYHAGHYRTVGAASHLRYNEDNVHKQCAPCNNHKSGNVVEYRINLVKRIGVDHVEALECNNTPVRHTKEDAQRIIEEYREKLKMLKIGVKSNA